MDNLSYQQGWDDAKSESEKVRKELSDYGFKMRGVLIEIWQIIENSQSSDHGAAVRSMNTIADMIEKNVDGIYTLKERFGDD